jgi:hypothetical protein
MVITGVYICTCVCMYVCAHVCMTVCMYEGILLMYVHIIVICQVIDI